MWFFGNNFSLINSMTKQYIAIVNYGVAFSDVQYGLGVFRVCGGCTGDKTCDGRLVIIKAIECSLDTRRIPDVSEDTRRFS